MVVHLCQRFDIVSSVQALMVLYLLGGHDHDGGFFCWTER